MSIFDIDRLTDDPFSRSRQAARPVWRQPATQEQTNTVGQDLLQKGGGFLHYIGSSLDKPGRAVRGLLGGKPQELLAALPFSDTLGITDPKNEVTGADLNKKYLGVRDDNSWKSWGAGLATETVLDPLNLVSFGAKSALTSAGKAAAKKGLTAGMSRAQLLKGFDASEDVLRSSGVAKEIVDHMRREGKFIVPSGVNIPAQTPLAGTVGLRIPFTGIAGAVGSGPVGQKIAAATDKAVDAIKYSVPGAKTLSALFDPSVQRARTEEMQRGFRAYGTPAKEAAERSNRALDAGLRAELHGLIRKGQDNGLWNERDLLNAAQMAAEGVTPSSVLPVHPDLWNAVSPLGAKLRQLGSSWLEESRRLGVNQSNLSDRYVSYFPRQGTKLASQNGIKAAPPGSLAPTGHGSMISRKKGLRDVPGGTALINRWVQDPALSGVSRTTPIRDVIKRIEGDMFEQAKAQGLWHPPMANDISAKARKVAKRLGKLSDEYAEKKIPLFSPDVLGAANLRAARQARVTTSAKTLYGTLGDIAQEASKIGPDAVPLTDVLSKLKGGPRLTTTLDPNDVPQGMLVELHKALAKQGLGPTEQVIGSLSGEDAMKALAEDVSQLAVTQEQAANIAADYGRFKAPGELSEPIKGIDSFTNAFRNLAYGAWLNSHVRNLTGGLVQAAVQSGTGPKDYGKMLSLLRNKATAQEIAGWHPGLPAGLTDDAARQWLKNQIEVNTKAFGGAAGPLDLPSNPAALAGQGGITAPEFGSDGLVTPREIGKAALESGKALGGAVRNPLRFLNPLAAFNPGGPLQMSGVRGGTKDFPWLETGKKIGSQVEQFLRGGQYLGEVGKGFDPAVAGQQVLKTHFDYQNLTPFEKNVMRRAVPFYTFMSRNLPLQLQTLASRPGRLMPQLRLATTTDGQFVPSHLASGVAIPTGPEQDGNRQFVTQLGLPTEEAFERIKLNPSDPLGSIRDTAFGYMGGLNPLIKGPLEWLFDKQFFSGRNLSDLRPQGPVGSLANLIDEDTRHRGLWQLAAQAAANSPATRFLTAVDKIADPRKPAWAKILNLATGVRVSDVDMDKSRAIETRKMLEGVLKNSPAVSQHTSLYVRPEDVSRLTPEEIAQLQVLARLQANARAAAKLRAQGQP